MFYPHTIKGKVNPRLDLISNPPIPTFPVSTADLNGTTQYFEYTSGAYDGSNNFCTISAWVYLPSISGIYTIINRGGNIDTFGDSSYAFRVANGVVILGVSETSHLGESTNTLTASTWHLVTGVVNGNGPVKIYIDGIEETLSVSNNYNSSDNEYSFNTPSQDGSIGARELFLGGFDRFFSGRLGFTAVWNVALTGGQVAALYNGGDALCYDELETKSPGITTGLISYWHLATFTGHTSDALTDQHGSNDLINVNSTPFTGTGLNVEC